MLKFMHIYSPVHHQYLIFCALYIENEIQHACAKICNVFTIPAIIWSGRLGDVGGACKHTLKLVYFPSSDSFARSTIH